MLRETTFFGGSFMQGVQEAPAAIDMEKLRAFADAMLSGDFSARLAVEGDPESDAAFAARMLNHFAVHMQRITADLTRLSKELVEGKFGGVTESVVSLRPGPLKEALEGFNKMEWALTEQIRNFAHIAKRLASGKTDREVTAPCEGETLELKNSLNAIREKLLNVK
jgi:hypothetical protein